MLFGLYMSDSKTVFFPLIMKQTSIAYTIMCVKDFLQIICDDLVFAQTRHLLVLSIEEGLDDFLQKKWDLICTSKTLLVPIEETGTRARSNKVKLIQLSA